MGLVSHRFSRQSSSTLVGALPLHALLLSLCTVGGSFTHTQPCRGACTTVSRCGALLQTAGFGPDWAELVQNSQGP
jgi:hypothetical protein